MSKATEQRIKQKLKNISKESKIPFNSLLDTLFLERFLVRIGKSQYADKLIFKGGIDFPKFSRHFPKRILYTALGGKNETEKKIHT